MTKNNTTEWEKEWIDAGQTDCHILLNKNKTMYIRKDIADQERLQARKDTLERCLELLPEENNSRPFPTEYDDGFNSCRFQAESAINEEINKSKV